MTTRRFLRRAARLSAASIGMGVAVYGSYAAATWLRYGQVQAASGDAADPLLDRFMPTYEIVERHRIDVAAPAVITLAAATEMDLQDSRVIRAVFRGRELLLGSKPGGQDQPRGIVALTKSLGWGVLAETPGREIVMGAVTQPWEADVVFRAIAPEAFAAFQDPGYVKIVWNLRADPVSETASIFRTETRAIATDPVARLRFRRYWSFLSPGIRLIRRASLGPLRADAERRAYDSRLQSWLIESR